MEVSDYNSGLFSRNGQGWGPALADNVMRRARESPIVRPDPLILAGRWPSPRLERTRGSSR